MTNKLWHIENWDKDCQFSIKIDKHLHSEQSEFQKIDFYQNETFGTFFTLDDWLMVTEKDEFVYHDMIVHVPMAVNPSIRKVLIIGGGDGGTAREVARYPHIQQIDMVEIDERVVRLSQQYLPITASKLEEDSRINLYFEDGLAFVKNAPEASYDLILVDSTDPIGPGEGLFTFDFYNNCYRVLNENGILINQHESPYFELNSKEMVRAHEKIRETFPIARVYQFHQPIYASGHWLFGFASKKLDPILDHKPELWDSLGLETKYYNSEIHKGSFAIPNFVKKKLNIK